MVRTRFASNKIRFAQILMVGQEENTRHAIESAKENYQIPWKVIHEALQNSLDAIYKCKKSGNITLTIDISEKAVSIRDDGIGFPHGDEGKRLLGLHGTDKKDDSRLLGNLGYGLKALICTTKSFRLVSHRDGKRWGFSVNDGYDLGNAEFIEDPIESESNVENGTELYYTFPNDEVVEALNEIYSSTPGIKRLDNYRDTIRYISKPGNQTELFKTAIEWYFRTATYVANLDRLIKGANSDVPKVQISIKLKCEPDDEGLRDKLEEDIYEVLRFNTGSVDIDFENKFWDVEEFFIDPKTGRTKKGLPFNIVNDLSLPVPSSQTLKPEQVIISKISSQTDYEKLIKYNPSKYVNSNRNIEYYENKVFRALEGLYLVVGRKRYLDSMLFPDMPARQRIFSRGIPTQDYVTLLPGGWENSRSDLTVALGMNVSDKLNLGKLQLCYRKRLLWLQEFYTDSFKAHIRRISSEVANKELTEPEDMNFPNDDEVEQEFVTRTKIFEAGAESNSVIVEPKYENELIALFFEFIGRGVIEGYQFYGVSGRSRFDGKAECKLPERPHFRASITQDSKLWTLEFKVFLSKLVEELEKLFVNVS